MYVYIPHMNTHIPWGLRKQGMMFLRLDANHCVINYEESRKDKFPLFEEFPIESAIIQFKKLEMERRNEWQIWKAALEVHQSTGASRKFRVRTGGEPLGGVSLEPSFMVRNGRMWTTGKRGGEMKGPSEGPWLEARVEVADISPYKSTGRSEGEYF